MSESQVLSAQLECLVQRVFVSKYEGNPLRNKKIMTNNKFLEYNSNGISNVNDHMTLAIISSFIFLEKVKCNEMKKVPMINNILPLLEKLLFCRICIESLKVSNTSYI
jgi:hypothetical protein